MAWNKKKLLAKISLYFDNKNISYEIEEDSILKLELYFKESEYVLYPYITIDQSICSFNINISKNVIKGYNYEKINLFNQKSKFFKAFILESGIVVLEYRFILNEMDSFLFDSILDSLYLLENDIETL